MAQCTGQPVDAAKLVNDALGLVHRPLIRFQRKSVNVENVCVTLDIGIMIEIPVARRLKELRERADVDMHKMAKAAGLKGASSYQHYENETLFTQKYLPLEYVEAWAPLLVSRGRPPIAESEVWDLAGSIAPGDLNAMANDLRTMEPSRRRLTLELIRDLIKRMKGNVPA